MEQLLTANVATNLYWLGRYLERIESTLLEIIVAYDKIIDVDKDAGTSLYRAFGVELTYTGAIDFLHEAALGDHQANLLAIMDNARENAIICRSQVYTEAFGEIIELHALIQNLSKSPTQIDYKFIDSAQSLISEIWGSLSKREHRNSSDYFIQLGKLVEEADLSLRLDKDKELALVIIDEIDTIVHTLAPDAPYYEPQFNPESDTVDMLNAVNNKIKKIIVA